MLSWSRHILLLAVVLVVTVLHVWMWRTLLAGGGVHVDLDRLARKGRNRYVI